MSATIETASDDEAGETPAAKPRSKKMMLIAAGALALVLLLGGGAAYFFLGGPPTGEATEAKAHGGACGGHGGGHGGEGEQKIVDVPAMVVNIRSPDSVPHFLKVHVMIVPGSKTEEQIKAELPMVLDAYQPFLRELRPEDLAGSAAVFRVKEELLVRTASVLGDGAAKDVLIQDLVQQ